MERAMEGRGERSSVAIVACREYSADVVYAAVRHAVGLLGGVSRFVRAGERILVKPNILAGDPPDRATTTHPAVVRAVARLLTEAGADVEMGDSPGVGSATSAIQKSGMELAIDGVARRADLSETVDLRLPPGSRVSSVPVVRPAVAADGIVSLPKLKTHALMRFTGAVKNQLGLVAGLHKARLHVVAPAAIDLAELLVRINESLRPRLYLMDAVVAMEGNGPRSGTARKVGALLASTDPVALDATAARMTNLNPDFVPTIDRGVRRGHGRSAAEEIELLGDPISSFYAPDFRVVRAPVGSSDLITHYAVLKNAFTARPVIDDDRCRRCGVCVDACPVPEKAVRFVDGNRRRPPAYDYSACIRCFCCQEMCPHEAIDVRMPLLGRLIGRTV